MKTRVPPRSHYAHMQCNLRASRHAAFSAHTHIHTLLYVSEPLAASYRRRANPAPVFSAVKQVDAHKLLTSSGENVFWQSPASSFTLYLAAAHGPPPARSTWQPPPRAFIPQAVACTHVQVCALMFARAHKTSVCICWGGGTKNVQPNWDKQKVTEENTKRRGRFSIAAGSLTDLQC